MNKKWTFLILIIAMLFSTLFYVKEGFEPRLHYALPLQTLKSLKNPSPKLSQEESAKPWGLEYTLGKDFYNNLNLYEAIVSFKKAAFLENGLNLKRAEEIQYDILFCYYLGLKYQDVIYTFETSILSKVEPSFPYFHDLLVILFESYTKCHEEEKAAKILNFISTMYPKTYSKLVLWYAFYTADFEKLTELSATEGPLKDLLAFYQTSKKSVLATQVLNTVLPGSGYCYLGQYQSAFTAFFLNGTFGFAAYSSFLKKSIAAGLIFASIDAGWYYGAVLGGGEEANFYNKKLYEKIGIIYLSDHQLFPIQLLENAI